jgi:hypothetical protein
VLFERICRENGIVARNTKPRSPTTTGKVERFHQTLQGELLDHVDVWPDVETAQAAIDGFRAEYNTNRPHQSLGMAFPADRFVPRIEGEHLPLHLPTTFSDVADRYQSSLRPGQPAEPATEAVMSAPEWHVTSWRDAQQESRAVEVTRIVPASGNLALRRQQFWLGPARAGIPVTLWADTAVVHLLIDGVRLKTVPSRLTAADLGQLLAEGGKPAGPPPVSTGPVTPGGPVEVERLVNACGLIALAGRQHPVGIQFAGRRLTVRIDRGVLQLAADGILLRSLPNPLTAAEIARIRDARPAGPAPVPAAEPIRVQRRVSTRGALVVAGERIHVGITHAGRTLDVESADRTIRIYDETGVLVAEAPRTTTKSIARFKVRRPELRPRGASSAPLSSLSPVASAVPSRSPRTP